MKNIGILGSTGSIGTQTLNVINQFPDEFNIKYLSCQENINLLIEQTKKYKPDTICIINEHKKNALETALKNTKVKIISGRSALLELSKRNDIDLMMNALVGSSGMEPTIEALTAQVDVALSNKESLVMAGHIINQIIEKNAVNLFPVDSEHSAIWQCLIGEKKEQINKIILTGSGGPFRQRPIENFKKIQLEDALKHPNWEMGNKITIDSASMMNKGLEVIEAHWLFNLTINEIEIIIHPQSIIHSMVEFKDGSIKAQLGLPDMKIPIQYALTYPNHLQSNWKKLDFTKINNLTFEKPDLEKFPCIRLAYESLQEGGTFPVVLNKANDEVVFAFLNGMIHFTDIPKLIEEALNNHEFIEAPDLEIISEISQWTTNFIHDKIAILA